jgi:hypothetical protein
VTLSSFSGSQATPFEAAWTTIDSALSSALFLAANCLASIRITDATPYTENFDTLVSSGGTSVS